MSGRHVQFPGHRPGWRWTAAAAGFALIAAAAGATIVSAGPANAAPKPTYHAGSDTATFTVTGVLDHNCLVSTGGTEIWIKPGDQINFNSALVGISVSDAVAGTTLGGILGGLLTPSQVAGLDVSAKIDPGKSNAQSVSVRGGSTTAFPKSGQSTLSAGDHKISWTATGLDLLPAVNHAPIALDNSSLKSGASLSWTGVIHVTNDAPKCKLSVGTPKTIIHAGPVKVTAPPINATVPGVTLPTSLPSVPNLLPSKSAGTKNGGKPGSKSNGGGGIAPPGLSIPQQIVPKGDGANIYGGGGGGYLGVAPNGSSQLGDVSPLLNNGAGKVKLAKVPGLTSQDSTGKNKSIDLASSKASPSGQLPVILAILAIIALALVAGTYARLFLLRRSS